MSHNKTSVAGQQPDNTGNVTIGFSNLDDISFSNPVENEVVKWNGSSWVNSSVPVPNAEIIHIGRGESSAYINSGASSLGSNDALRIYDSNPRNTISSATLNQYQTSGWYTSVTLPIGLYQVIAQFSVEFSASGYCSIELANSSTGVNRSLRAVIGDNADALIPGGSTTITGVFELTSSETLELRIKNIANIDTFTPSTNPPVDNQGNTISEFSYLFIHKLS